MRVLCFSHTPPPRSGKIFAERLFNILKEWGIEKKVFTICWSTNFRALILMMPKSPVGSLVKSGALDNLAGPAK